MIENRVRILEAARRVYSHFGWRGATTRRIAEAAGVNEVTIFRQFGNKGALLEAVLADCASNNVLPPLPEVPADPERELTAWAVAHHDRLCGIRELIRQMMGQMAERPEVAACAANGPRGAASLLRQYVVNLRKEGWLEGGDVATHPADTAAEVPLLLGTLFADAMGRDFMPDMYPSSPSEAVASYVRLFLRAVGVRQSPREPAVGGARDVTRGTAIDPAS